MQSITQETDVVEFFLGKDRKAYLQKITYIIVIILWRGYTEVATALRLLVTVKTLHVHVMVSEVKRNGIGN